MVAAALVEVTVLELLELVVEVVLVVVPQQRTGVVEVVVVVLLHQMVLVGLVWLSSVTSPPTHLV
jgi:hypothetical protein